MTTIFAIKGWIRRRWPAGDPWTPPQQDRDRQGWLWPLLGAALTAAMIAVYVAPGPVLGFVTGGRIDAETAIYHPAFTGLWSLRQPWLPLLLACGALLQLYVAWRGRWDAWTRWAEIFILIDIAVQLGWHMTYGSVFLDPHVESFGFRIAALVMVVIAIEVGFKIYMELGRVSVRRAVAPARVS